MSDQKESWEDHLKRLEQGMRLLIDRVDRIEKHLGIEPESEADENIAHAMPEPVSSEQAAPQSALNRFDLSPVPSTAPQAAGMAAQQPSEAQEAPEAGLDTAATPPGSPQPSAGSFSFPEDSASEKTFDWESLVGRKWTLWVGIVGVFFALAYFLPNAWSYLSPIGRLAVGLFTGLAFLGAGEMTRGRVERGFSAGMIGGGLAILYLSIWAGAHRYGLLTFELAFGLMAATAALGVYMSLRYDAVSLTTLSTVGGFLTPLMIRSGGEGASGGTLFLTYIALLDAGILAVSLFKRWRGIIWLSYISTIVIVFGWAADSYAEPQRWTVFTFVTLYFLLFLGASCFYSLIRKEATRPEDLILLFTNAFLYSVAGYGLLYDVMGRFPAAFSLALALFFALLTLATRTLAPENGTLRDSAGGLSLFFVTISIPIQLRQEWIAVAWSVEAAVLLTLGIRFGSLLFRRFAQVIWCISLLAILAAMSEARIEPGILFLNGRAFPLLASVLATGWMAFLALQNREEQESGMASIYPVYTVLAGAWLIAQETYLGFSWRQFPSPQTWQAGALCTVACLWSFYAIAVFWTGLEMRSRTIRFSAVTVAAMATVLPMWAGQTQAIGEWTPFMNLRWLSYIVVILTLGFLGWLISREKEGLEPEENDLLRGLPSAISLVVLWSMTVEIHDSFRWWAGPAQRGWETAALLTVTIFWSVFASTLLFLGLTWARREFRILAFCIGGIAVFLLMASLGSDSFTARPILNLRFLAFAVLTAMFAFGPWMSRRYPRVLHPAENRMLSSGAILAAILGMWGLTQETYETARWLRNSLGENWERIAGMWISLVWTFSATGLLIGGILRNHRPIRLFALGLFGLTVLKVFLIDLSFLNIPYRILSLGGLGLALIGVSWLYNRYGIGQKAQAGT